MSIFSVTPAGPFSLGLKTENLTLATTVADLLAQAGEFSTSGSIIMLGRMRNYMHVQVYGTASASIFATFFGVRENPDAGLWSPFVIGMVQVAIGTAGPGSNAFLGDTLCHGLTYTETLAGLNMKIMNGSGTYKVPGSVLLDGLGGMDIGVRLPQKPRRL